MKKKLTIAILLLFALTISISGCTTKTAQNGTFGEKKISLDKFSLTNVISEHYEFNDTQYYIIEGNITNNNDLDAIDIKMEAIAYDENGTVVATNNTPYLEPKTIPADITGYFNFIFNDPDKRIVRYEIKMISAKAIY